MTVFHSKPPLHSPSVGNPLTLRTILATMIACATLGAIGNTVFMASADKPHLAAATSVRAWHYPSQRPVVKPAKRAALLLPVVDQPDILPKHRQLADSTLRALPSYCRDSLHDFYVVYNNPSNRGLAGETEMIIAGNEPGVNPPKPVPDAEFRALITHECGHIIDLGAIRGTSAAGGTEFYDGKKPIHADDPSVKFYRISWTSAKTMRKDAFPSNFVSGYAMSDAFEDFAESFAFFVLQRQEFQRLAKNNPALQAKYDYIATLMTDQPDIANGTFVRGKKQPWDVTKLPYAWIGASTQPVTIAERVN